jgi:hypothetical protein
LGNDWLCDLLYIYGLARPGEAQGIHSSEKNLVPRHSASVPDMTEQRAPALVLKGSFKIVRKAFKYGTQKQRLPQRHEAFCPIIVVN